MRAVMRKREAIEPRYSMVRKPMRSSWQQAAMHIRYRESVQVPSGS